MTGEFDFIETMLAPLAGPQALRLKDDAAWFAQERLIITKDVLVAGTHFFDDDPPDLIARKALRANISDLTAKGAKPLCYFLGLVLPSGIEDAALIQLVEGFRQDQTLFDLTLAGGDTVRHSDEGPLTISVTLVGTPHHRPVLRSGAAPGDILIMTGTIGDGVLGLMARQGKLAELSENQRAELVQAYLLPSPPAALAGIIGRYAHAALDISDGLLADATHLAAASAISIEIAAGKVALSEPARSWVATRADTDEALLTLLNGGDDYQTLLAIPPQAEQDLFSLSQKTGVALHKIGSCGSSDAESRVIMPDGTSRALAEISRGYDHFTRQ